MTNYICHVYWFEIGSGLLCTGYFFECIFFLQKTLKSLTGNKS